MRNSTNILQAIAIVHDTSRTQNAMCLQARTLCVNPLYMMVPTTLASSFAFMLPVATPPNTIVFAYGNLKIKDMVSAVAYVCIKSTIISLLLFEKNN